MRVSLTITATLALLIATSQIYALRAEEQFLISVHRHAGLSCAQCHQEQPPRVAPPSAKCIGCHGDQQVLAKKTESASPNPHAPPHAQPGETPVCTECHHIHRASEVSCSSCHRDFFFNVK
jgi:Cytochrome c3